MNAYRHSMDAFAWGVIGSVAGVVGAVAVIVLGIIPLWQNRQERRQAIAEPAASQTRDDLDVQTETASRHVGQSTQAHTLNPARAQPDGPVIVGEIPQAPPAFQSRQDLTSALVASGPGTVLVYALTGMRGVGKTQIAAAYVRSRIDAKWRLVAWVNAADLAGVLNGLAETASRLGLGELGGSLESSGDAVRHWLEADGEQCLVVFDNLTDLDHLARYLPIAGRAQVVVTSNNVDAGSSRCRL